MSPYIILGPHKYFSHIIQIFFMLLGLRKCYLHKSINCHGPSHKYYPLQPTYYPIWVFTKILIILLLKLGHKIYIILTQSPTSFGLWAKSKESPKFQKSHYDVANSMSHYDMANSKSLTTMWLILKSATMRHYLQSPLLHDNTLQNLKIISTRPKFLFDIYFHKAQILIWHLFSQSPNSNLALLYKAQILFWQLSLYSFINPKY